VPTILRGLATATVVPLRLLPRLAAPIALLAAGVTLALLF
jgi:hypothetical protein